jgi:hypothetical protein
MTLPAAVTVGGAIAAFPQRANSIRRRLTCHRILSELADLVSLVRHSLSGLLLPDIDQVERDRRKRVTHEHASNVITDQGDLRYHAWQACIWGTRPG